MQASSVTERAARPDVRNLGPQVKRSSSKAPKRRTRAQGYHIELPRNLWDGTILLVFICCLFIFLHALFGFSFVDEGVHVLNDTFVYPHARFSTPGAPNEDQKIRTQDTTRVMVEWHGSYELFPGTTSASISPAPIPHHSMITKTKTSVDTPFMVDGKLYDHGGSEHRGAYPVAESARPRRFGRCPPGEACF